MASLAAKAVAQEVLETLGKGERPNVSKIGVKKGYTPKQSASGNIQQTKTYKAAMKPVIDRMMEERDRAIKAMRGKISKAKYRDLVDSADKLTKNIQLLSGGATDDIKIRWE